MRAVGYKKSLPIENPQALLDLDIDKPAPTGRDLLVQVKAISVNPVDTKVRKRAAPKDGEPPKILGYDATGIVTAAGPDVTLFKTGEEVWYAGSIIRPGTNAEFHLVDERIVGRKPKTLSFAQAAALPLTSITAWELLFDRFRRFWNEQHYVETMLRWGADLRVVLPVHALVRTSDAVRAAAAGAGFKGGGSSFYFERVAR